MGTIYKHYEKETRNSLPKDPPSHGESHKSFDNPQPTADSDVTKRRHGKDAGEYTSHGLEFSIKEIFFSSKLLA